MAYASIKNWPEDERPRERILRYGPASMSDAQLIAIILRTGDEGRSAIDIGMEMLATFGCLKNIEQASVTELCSVKGLGKAKAAQLRAALELGQRLFKLPMRKGAVFTTGRDVYSYYQPRFKNLKREVFCGAMLDAKNRLIKETKISEGILTSALIHPREAFRDAIKESAASILFVHNHPSGDPQPSREDIAITKKLQNAGEIVGITVLDHIIIGDGSYTSMLERGYFKKNRV